MTDLVCLTAVKNRERTQSAQARQASEVTIPQACKKSNKKADKLYHIEVVEEEGKVKVHYTGYSSDFDEWKEA